ncbi:MAG: GIY-YIG nuclease family protein [bacterium]|nr:GIY-YIG nuclease family protein [bacterium]
MNGGLPHMYYFYILRSKRNRKLYLGQTADLKARIKSHNAGENKATKPNIPYELIFYSAFNNEGDAINSEQYFKTTAGWKRLSKMLENTLKVK